MLSANKQHTIQFGDCFGIPTGALLGELTESKENEMGRK